MTKDAASLVRTLVEGAGLPPQAGLRIATDFHHHDLSMRLATSNGSDDSVVVRDDAHVFLSPPVALHLKRRTLCAEIGAARSTFFLDREDGPRTSLGSRRRAAK
ncbi:MAG TPA: hypothetical protein VLR26_06995 [Frankiaceae bacterium]|nr:hypothetical protein [Frankiaceae bacterium]